ncbi:MAG: XRE family transcriptional regulator [Thermodesulfovibrionales bacterium]|nr:XRE family transcriptional regulator [Thermodesulfovibrionales bacterium]
MLSLSMDRNKAIATLLRKERESLKYTLKDVSQGMGFSNYQTLSSIESGEREIKAWERARLAELYGKRIDYFLSEQTEISQPKVLWRDPAKTENKTETERKFISFCLNYKRLLGLTTEENIKLPYNIQPDKTEFKRGGFEYTVELAEELRRTLNLGGRPAYSLSNVLEQVFNILVLYMDLGMVCSGASTSGDFGKAILVNSSDAPWRRNYDLAHELFHLITWDIFSDEEIYPKTEKGKSEVEQWADAFASALLLPSEEVRREFSKRLEDNKITYISLVEIAQEFKVSIEALLWRLVNLNLLKRNVVNQLINEEQLKDINKKMRVTDWADEKPYLSSRYITLAIKALQAGKISKLKFAEYIDKPFSEVSSFLRKYGYDENEDYSVAFAAA